MHDTKRWSLAAPAALLIAGAAHATTWTVDDDGGADFTDVPAALAVAQPGDTVLVLPGSYSPFALTAAVTVIGYDADVGGTVAVETVSGRAILSGFSCDQLDVAGCPGRVLIERMAVSGHATAVDGAVVTIVGSSDVRLRACTVEALGYGLAVGVEIEASRVELTDSTIEGAEGQFTLACEDGEPGSAGILCRAGADLHLSSSTVRGGFGGDGITQCLNISDGGDGAPGVELLAGAQLLATGTADDLVAGGRGGFSDLGNDGQDAPGLLIRAGATARVSGVEFANGWPFGAGIHNLGTLDEVDPVDASFVLVGEPVAGATVTFVVRGPVGASARIRLGRAPRVIDLPTTYEDRLLAPLRLVSLGGIGPSGEATLSFTLGATWPAGTLLVAQGSCTTDAGTTLSQSVPVIVR